MMKQLMSRTSKNNTGPLLSISIGIVATLYGVNSIIVRQLGVQSSILVILGIFAIMLNGWPLISQGTTLTIQREITSKMKK